jgi:hypothetical protein
MWFEMHRVEQMVGSCAGSSVGRSAFQGFCINDEFLLGSCSADPHLASPDQEGLCNQFSL